MVNSTASSMYVRYTQFLCSSHGKPNRIRHMRDTRVNTPHSMSVTVAVQRHCACGKPAVWADILSACKSIATGSRKYAGNTMMHQPVSFSVRISTQLSQNCIISKRVFQSDSDSVLTFHLPNFFEYATIARGVDRTTLSSLASRALVGQRGDLPSSRPFVSKSRKAYSLIGYR